MLEIGVFWGRYLRDCVKEFPSNWFKNAKFHPEGKPGHTNELNFFGVNASQPLSVWKKKLVTRRGPERVVSVVL